MQLREPPGVFGSPGFCEPSVGGLNGSVGTIRSQMRVCAEKTRVQPSAIWWSARAGKEVDRARRDAEVVRGRVLDQRHRLVTEDRGENAGGGIGRHELCRERLVGADGQVARTDRDG